MGVFQRAVLGAGVMLAIVLPAWWAWSQGPAARSRRAAPPKFSSSDIQGVFFENLFAEQGPLVGDRPAGGVVVAAAKPASGGAPAAGGSSAPAVAVGSGWSQVISATTLEDEVKALNLQVDETVTTPAKFAGTGHRDAQKQFSLLAMLFGIIGEYDGDVRWKAGAPVLRDRFARAAANTKAGGNIQVYNEAKLRRDDLAGVIRGSSIDGDDAEPAASWDSVIARSPLMRILEERSAKTLQRMTASQAEFSKEPEKILHESELLAAMSEVLTKEGMDDADDPDYAAFVKRMKQGALDVVSAVKLNNADQARKAVGEITQACSECHELYR